MRSASSSTTQTMYGYGRYSRSEPSGVVISPDLTLRLKSLIWRTRVAFMSMYRCSISSTSQVSAAAAFFGWVMIGVMRCGMPSYGVSSTIFGSMRMRRTSSGVARVSKETNIEFTNADLPEPVEPATSRCGIFCNECPTKSPSMFLPRPISIGSWLATTSEEPSTSPRRTISRSEFGTSMPTADLPGIGVSSRTLSVATA